MSGARPPWDFGYAPVTPAAVAPEDARELIVATADAVAPATLLAALPRAVEVERVLARRPLFWTRVVLAEPAPLDAVAADLRAGGVPVRYVASASQPSLSLGSPLDLTGAPPARAESWPIRRAPAPPLDDAPGSWFLRDGQGGVAVDRARSRGGAGTRLAVIDDDAMEADRLDLDAEVLVGIDAAPRHAVHGALMVAWAAGARGFAGVAPSASARLYLIPKPGRGLVALPLAIARAVCDGADVVVCATYVEGSTSPMLDDALTLASRLGRRGRGAAVVLPTGREASSPPGSLHASFSLGLGEPASDPRAFCVGPGARGEGWFLWRDRRGKLRPFANRGPAVRWLAPGDDLAYPFATPPRLFHAESSGASAIAAGVLLLVLAENPSLRVGELAAVVDATLAPVSPEVGEGGVGQLTDAADALPVGRDRDGHNAKHGHGRLHAGRACLAAWDPICAALLAMGEDTAARAYADARRLDPEARDLYPARLARWMVRALLADGEAAQTLRVVLRHLRLVAGDAARARAHGDGAVARPLHLFVRGLAQRSPRPPPARLADLAALEGRLASLVRVVGAAFALARAERQGPPAGG
jgi:hypothetical protein